MLKRSNQFLVIFFTIFILFSYTQADKLKSDSLSQNDSCKVNNKEVYGIGYGKFDNVKKSKININKAKLKVAKPEIVNNGKRTEENIFKGILDTNKLASLRYAYNRRLREKPDLEGRITFKFSIVGTGKISHCEEVSSTFKDKKFKKILIQKILKWDMGDIEPANDTTIVVYPFVFMPCK